MIEVYYRDPSFVYKYYRHKRYFLAGTAVIISGFCGFLGSYLRNINALLMKHDSQQQRRLPAAQAELYTNMYIFHDSPLSFVARLLIRRVHCHMRAIEVG